MKKQLIFTAVALAGSLALTPAMAQQGQQGQQSQENQPKIGQQQDQDQDQQKQQQQSQDQQQAQQGQQGQQGNRELPEQQQSPYARQLANAGDIKGMQIQDTQGNDLGSVDQVIIDTQNGKVAFVVTSTGGFWGIGGKQAIIPWNALRVQQQGQVAQQGQQGQQVAQQGQGQRVLVLNIPKDQLKNAPQGDISKILDRQQAEQISQFYGVAPYWEEGAQQGQQGQMMSPQQRGEMMNRMQHTDAAAARTDAAPADAAAAATEAAAAVAVTRVTGAGNGSGSGRRGSSKEPRLIS